MAKLESKLHNFAHNFQLFQIYAKNVFDVLLFQAYLDDPNIRVYDQMRNNAL